MYNEGERRSIFYAESWAATHYLMTTRPDGAAAINEYVKAVSEGRTPGEAFRGAFGATPEEFDKELRTYIRRLRFLVQRFTFSEKLAVAEPSAGRAMTRDEVEAWFGIAQLRVKRIDEASPRIEKAAATEPPTAAGQLGLGLLRLERQELPQALGAFTRAAALAPDDFMTQYVAGFSRLQADPQGSEERRVEALAVLKRAARLNPASADAFAALAYVQMLSPDTLGDARTSIERAVLLAPGKLSHRLRYADILILQDQLDDARRMLTAIAAVKSDGTAARGAAARLETLADYERRVAAQQERFKAAAAAASVTGRATPPPEPSTPSTELANTVRPDATRDRQTGFLLRKVRPGAQCMVGALTRVDCSVQTVRLTGRGRTPDRRTRG